MAVKPFALSGEETLLAKVGFGWSFRKIEFWLVCRLVSDCGVQFAGDAPPELFGLESSRKTFQKVELLGRGTLAQPREAPAAQATCGELKWVTRAKVLTRAGPKGLRRWSLNSLCAAQNMHRYECENSPSKVGQLILVSFKGPDT